MRNAMRWPWERCYLLRINGVYHEPAYASESEAEDEADMEAYRMAPQRVEVVLSWQGTITERSWYEYPTKGDRIDRLRLVHDAPCERN